jgi:hypothetical protein
MSRYNIEERMAVAEEKIRSLEKSREDSESRLRRIERAIYVGIGGLGLLQILFRVVGH